MKNSKEKRQQEKNEWSFSFGPLSTFCLVVCLSIGYMASDYFAWAAKKIRSNIVVFSLV